MLSGVSRCESRGVALACLKGKWLKSLRLVFLCWWEGGQEAVGYVFLMLHVFCGYVLVVFTGQGAGLLFVVVVVVFFIIKFVILLLCFFWSRVFLWFVVGECEYLRGAV